MNGSREYFEGSVRVHFESSEGSEEVAPLTEFFLTTVDANKILRNGYMDIKVNTSVTFRHKVSFIKRNRKGRITGITLDYDGGNRLESLFSSQHRSK